MKEIILKQLKYFEEKGWITINKNLEEENLALRIELALKETPLKEFINWLLK